MDRETQYGMPELKQGEYGIHAKGQLVKLCKREYLQRGSFHGVSEARHDEQDIFVAWNRVAESGKESTGVTEYKMSDSKHGEDRVCT